MRKYIRRVLNSAEYSRRNFIFITAKEFNNNNQDDNY